jgi:hypothetical protein
LLRAKVAACNWHAWWLKFGRIDQLEGAILGVSVEINQISDAPRLGCVVNIFLYLGEIKENRAFILPILWLHDSEALSRCCRPVAVFVPPLHSIENKLLIFNRLLVSQHLMRIASISYSHRWT